LLPHHHNPPHRLIDIICSDVDKAVGKFVYLIVTQSLRICKSDRD
jgi:hypothetical protein